MSNAKWVGREGTVRVGTIPGLPKPLILGPVLVIQVPNCVKIKLPIRTPEKSAVLLAEQTSGTDSLLVILLLPSFGIRLPLRFMEAVHRTHQS